MDTESLSQLAVSETIASAGLFVQTVNALLIFLLLFLLDKTDQQHPYIKFWRLSWAYLVFSLLSLNLYYFLPDEWLSDIIKDGINAAYLVGKVLHYLFLVVGMYTYASHDHQQGRLTGYNLTIFAGMIVLFIGQLFAKLDTNAMVFLQSPFAALAFFYSVGLLGKCSGEMKKTLALNFTRSVLIVSGLLWVSYTLFFPYQSDPAIALVAGEWFSFTNYNSYYDLVLQMLLAFGQVMLTAQHNHFDLIEAHDALKHQSLTDHLTGIFNRQALHEHNRKSDIDKGASIVVCGLDNLKHINHEHGHAEGDNLLRHFVIEVGKRLRNTDLIYRWGGDEFVLILAESTRQESDTKMELLQEEIGPLVLPDGTSSALGFSYGISYSRQSGDIEEAIRTADRRMYLQKEKRKK